MENALEIINSILTNNGMTLGNNTIIVERLYTRPLKRWGRSITISINNGAVSATTDWEGEIDAVDIDRVVYYFLGEYGAEDIMSITLK